MPWVVQMARQPRSKPTEIGIYQIKNLINGKLYIGSAKDFHIRTLKHLNFLKHNKHHCKHLQAAWNKYGENNFKFELIERCEKEMLINREQYWIDKLNPAYNVALNAGNTLGTKRTIEQKLNISASQKGIKRSEKARYNMAQCKIGYRHSSQAIANMKEAQRNISPWPHPDGRKCKCTECVNTIKEERRTRNRKYYHEKAKSHYQQ